MLPVEARTAAFRIIPRMALSIASLNSGSNGNCYYVGNEREAVLVDAGISCREIERRMKRLELDMRKVKALFISHEHSDHIRGVEVLARKHQLPVYITRPTLLYSGMQIDEQLVSTFEAYRPIEVGGLKITAFPKLHDASDPHSFVVEGNGTRIGVFTDIGSPCRHVIENFKLCDAVFLEANYDEEMLEQGRYPYHLKKRIRSDKGHLSNHQALHLFNRHRNPGLSLLLLSHLSKENNSPERALQLFVQHAHNTKVVVASRFSESPVFHVRSRENKLQPAESIFAMETVQLSLF